MTRTTELLKELAQMENNFSDRLERRQNLEYAADVNFSGINVKKSPFVKEIILEEGIFIRQIKGKIKHEEIKIACEVNSSGRIQFRIPTRQVSDTNVNDFALSLFKKLVGDKIERVDQISIDAFLEGDKSK